MALISTVNFNTYISGCKVGYDYVNKEIIVSNSTYTYSYVYCLQYKTWHKIDGVYDYFYYELPDLYGFNASNDLFKLDTEASGYKNVLIF